MSLSPSPPRDKPQPKKKFMFKRAALKDTTETSSKDEVGFFSRREQNYTAAIEAEEELKKKKPREAKNKKKAHEGEDDDEAGSPPKRTKRRSLVNDEDSGEEVSSTQRRHANTRQRYKNAITLSDSDDDPSLSKWEKTDKNSNKSRSSKSRIRESSLTPPPVLYADNIYPKPVPSRTSPINPPPGSRSASDSRKPSSPPPRQSSGIGDDGDDDGDVILTSITLKEPPLDEDDEMLAAIERRARERVAARQQVSNSPSNPLSSPPPDPIVSILVTSEIAGTGPLVVRRRANQSLKPVRVAWCSRQGFTEDQTADIFLTWKGNKVFDHNSCRGIGIGVDDLGNLADQEGMRDNNIHFEAMTAEMLAEKEREREMRYSMAPEEEEEEAEPVQEITMRLTLKSKGYEDFKIKVRPETKISKLISAFRAARSIDEVQDITLDFDGDTLDPKETIGDTELEDMFGIDVYIN